MQPWGLARAFGAVVREWRLVEDRASGRWRADLDALEALVGPKTKLIAVCTPNNPTGARLTDGDLDAVARAADRVGAWVLADEIYRGAELDGREAPSMWGRSNRVIVTSGLSKAYGLPGLRIGWIVSTAAFAAEAWERHDYTTIGPSGVTDHLAALALGPGTRERILARTRGILNENWPVLEEWLRRFGDTFTWTPPEAGAICFARYRPRVSGLDLVERLRAQHDVLLVPGEHFGLPGYIRFGMGEERAHFKAALAATEAGLRDAFRD
jgi:aspartate/methionine/tyrosine aminotransferase